VLKKTSDKKKIMCNRPFSCRIAISRENLKQQSLSSPEYQHPSMDPEQNSGAENLDMTNENLDMTKKSVCAASGGSSIQSSFNSVAMPSVLLHDSASFLVGDSAVADSHSVVHLFFCFSDPVLSREPQTPINHCELSHRHRRA
jgi:hypothetical protein